MAKIAGDSAASSVSVRMSNQVISEGHASSSLIYFAGHLQFNQVKHENRFQTQQ